jgi:hypothetical protein
MVDATLVYTDGTPLLTRGALTGDVTASAGSNTTAIAAGVIVNADINGTAAIDATKIADGTVTNTEFQYIGGLTSDAQTQLSAKQASDATLTALAAYNTNGILTQTNADTFAGRTITGTASEITVTNGDGVAGNPTLSLATGIDATKIGAGGVTSTEFGYIAGLTSDAQTQLNAKFLSSNVIDEDNMVSNLDTKVPTQQSVKAYIDAAVIASGSGDVVGPGAATDNALARFDSTTGKLIQDNANATCSDAGVITAVGFAGPLTGNVTGNASGNAGTATTLQTTRAIGGVNFNGSADITPTQIQPASEAADTTCFPTFFNAASGTAQQPKYNSSFGYNASTNTLTATTFSGALSGNATTATTLATPRSIYGANFDGSAALAGPVGVAYGGTGLATLTANNVILGNGTSTPAFVAPSTSGNVLTSNGTTWTSAAPASSSSFVLLATYSPSAAASVDITSVMTSSYFAYDIYFDLTVATDLVSLYLRTSTNNSAFDSGASDYDSGITSWENVGSSGASTDAASSAQISLSGTNTIGNAAGEGASGKISIVNPNGTSGPHCISWVEAHRHGATGAACGAFGTAMRLASTDIDAVRILASSGNISGTVKIYGIKAT